MIPIIRALVRPVLTGIGFGVFSYLTLKHPAELASSYIPAVMLMLGFWFGERKRSNPPGGTPT